MDQWPADESRVAIVSGIWMDHACAPPLRHWSMLIASWWTRGAESGRRILYRWSHMTLSLSRGPRWFVGLRIRDKSTAQITSARQLSLHREEERSVVTMRWYRDACAAAVCVRASLRWIVSSRSARTTRCGAGGSLIAWRLDRARCVMA